MDNDTQEQPGAEPNGETPERIEPNPSPPRSWLGPGPAGIILPVVWCAVVSSVGLLGLGAIPVFLTVAICTAWKRTRLALFLVVLAGVAVSVTLRDPVGVAFSMLTSASGLLLGTGFARQWTYGRTVAVTTAALFCVNALFLVYSWDSVDVSLSRYLSMLRAQQALQDGRPVPAEATPENGDVPPAQEQAAEETPSSPAPSGSVLELYEWLYPRWPNIVFGSVFATILTGVCIAASGTSSWLRRRFGLPGPRGSFLTTRTPDGLVWLVILTAALWFADRQWAGTIMRPISWNAAIALAGVYWLNGLSVLFYAMRMLQVAPALIGLMVAGLVCFGMQPIALLGLFDTWIGFRRRVDVLVELKKRREDSGGDES